MSFVCLKKALIIVKNKFLSFFISFLEILNYFGKI